MRTIRRLYFYAVAFISLEVVLWGLINLARATFVTDTVFDPAEQLAQALSLVLVGIPVFILHWVTAQRSARQEEDEHASAVRAVFLYGTLLATLLPIVQNVWALLNRLLLQAFGLSTALALLGENQSSADNLIAILMNGIIAAYFITVTQNDWKSVKTPHMLTDVRRLYRYLWAIYALGLLITGVYQVLRFIFYVPGEEIRTSGHMLANGLALLLISLPLWIWTWNIVQTSLKEKAESSSSLRLGILYLLSLGGAGIVLVSSGFILNVVLNLTLGKGLSFGELINEISNPISLGIPFAGVWAYYGSQFRQTLEGLDEMQRAGVRRLYFYVLALIGLLATFIGLSMLLSFILDLGLERQIWSQSLHSNLAAALATLLTGLPLWFLTWRPMQHEALSPGERGDHARRSIVRKAYLYLVLFVAVVGGMVTAGAAVYLALNALLGESRLDLLGDFSDATQWFVLFMGLLAYHLYTLRHDGAQSGRGLSLKHSQFPVLIFDPGDGTFGADMQTALYKQSARLPVQVQLLGEGVPQEAVFRAVIVPANLALNPPEALRLWLRNFNGSRLIVPIETPGWMWVCAAGRSRQVIEQTAVAVRQLAEGSEARGEGVSGWMILIYVLAGLATLPIILFLLGLFFSAIAD
ncbi:MAG: DUF5671 domain-containing protein [Candidatus Villigracilaceae bacterium]